MTIKATLLALIALSLAVMVNANCSMESNPDAAKEAMQCVAETREASKGEAMPEGGVQELVCKFLDDAKEQCVSGFAGCSDAELDAVRAEMFEKIKGSADPAYVNMLDSC